jgi:hypothetical protein
MVGFFKRKIILFSRWNDGKVEMCVFEGTADKYTFYCTQWARFTVEGMSESEISIRQIEDIYHRKKLIQWQPATLEQIKEYDYEKYLDPNVQFPYAIQAKEQ